MLQAIDACVACATPSGAVWLPENDLTHIDHRVNVEQSLLRSDFSLCLRCGLLFARRRFFGENLQAHYQRFAELENRTYAVYPPPPAYRAGKEKAARQLADQLTAFGLIQPTTRILHIRCDFGSLLTILSERVGRERVFGLDYFESNQRYGREVLGLEHLAPLICDPPSHPFGSQPFDLVLCNHQLTHSPQPKSLLRWLHEILAPGGSVIFYNEPDHRLAFADNRLLDVGVNHFHFQLLTEDSFQNFLHLGGWEAKIFGHAGAMLQALVRPTSPTSIEELPLFSDTRWLTQLEAWRTRYDKRKSSISVRLRRWASQFRHRRH